MVELVTMSTKMKRKDIVQRSHSSNSAGGGSPSTMSTLTASTVGTPSPDKDDNEGCGAPMCKLFVSVTLVNDSTSSNNDPTSKG